MDWEIFTGIVFIVIGFLFGLLLYSVGFLHPTIVYKCLDGLYTKNSCNFEGEWVHVNIGNMSFKRALEVCQHEVGHEIFAEICEKNFTKCLNITN